MCSLARGIARLIGPLHMWYLPWCNGICADWCEEDIFNHSGAFMSSINLPKHRKMPLQIDPSSARLHQPKMRCPASRKTTNLPHLTPQFY
jgi:hypothetical protein